MLPPPRLLPESQRVHVLRAIHCLPVRRRHITAAVLQNLQQMQSPAASSAHSDPRRGAERERERESAICILANRIVAAFKGVLQAEERKDKPQRLN